MIVLGLGSNLGDRSFNLHWAISELSQSTAILKNLKVSSIYETPALLPPSAPSTWDRPFLNIAISGESALSPKELLLAIKQIEKKLGRKNRERWAPREIDIDILVYNDLEYEDAELKIPHPGLLERPFALLPLLEVFPNWKSKRVNEKNWSKSDFINRKKAIHSGLVGIVNITPDSFSDGGKYEDAKSALTRIQEFIEQGAHAIDIGAESTRPGATSLSADEEWRRLAPLMESLPEIIQKHQSKGVRFSIDTRHPETATKSIEVGFHWINDVTGFSNPEMIKTVRQSELDLVVMHSLSVPVKKGETIPTTEDPVEFLIRWAEKRFSNLKEAGISRDRIIFDPGIGFGTSPEQSLEILSRAQEFHKLGVRLLFGYSRKSFLNLLTDQTFANRDLETLGITFGIAPKGIHYLRVHNIEFHQRALRTYSAIRK